jgi:hypothetical protein
MLATEQYFMLTIDRGSTGSKGSTDLTYLRVGP